MDDVPADPPTSPQSFDHPVSIGALALPGALAGGALLPRVLAWGGIVCPEELSVFLGAFGGAALTLRALRALLRRARAEHAAAESPAAWTPVESRARLQLVCGTDAAWIAAGAASLAAPRLTRGERVLVVDAGLGAALHAWLGGVPRLGLAECMSERVPVLGLVQRGPADGLWLLARGGARRFDAWSQLGRVLDEACSHFPGVIVAAPATALPALREGFRGRGAAGWWSGREAVPRSFQDRFGISLGSLHLRGNPHPSGEALRQSLAGASHAPAGPPVWGPAVPSPAPPAPSVESPVLDCDLHVRERLRFLVWMRRIQAERRADAQPTSAGR